jgi:hypothetical protein
MIALGKQAAPWCSTLVGMRCALVSFLCLVPPLHAQIARPTDPVFFGAALGLVAPPLPAGVRRDGPSFGNDQSMPARMFDGSRALWPWSARALEVRSTLDSARTPQGHVWLGAVIGLGLGAGAGYLVAIPRVRATERHSDGAPFQQIEYVIDPVVGGLIGSIVGIIVGSHLH